MRDQRLERVAVPSELHDGGVIGGLERVVPPQDVGGLPERQPEVGPVERDVGEAHDRTSGRALRAQPFGVDLNPRERHARLHAALHVDQGELHVDRAGQLGLCGPELLELDDFARLGARGAWRWRLLRLLWLIGHGRHCRAGAAACESSLQAVRKLRRGVTRAVALGGGAPALVKKVGREGRKGGKSTPELP